MLQKAQKKNLPILKNTEKSKKKSKLKVIGRIFALGVLLHWAFCNLGRFVTLGVFLFGVLYPLLLFWVKQTSVGIGFNIDFSHLLFCTFLYAMYFEYSITFYAIFDEFPMRCKNMAEKKTAHC